MKIDFSAQILDLDGKPIPAQFDKDGNAVGSDMTTLSTVCCRALLASYPDEQTLSAKEKMIRFRLACKITGADEADLTVEEVAELKKLIGKAFAPLVVGRAFDILDPPGEAPEIKKANGRHKTVDRTALPVA